MSKKAGLEIAAGRYVVAQVVVVLVGARDHVAARLDGSASAMTGMLLMPTGPSEPGSAPNQSLISAGDSRGRDLQRLSRTAAANFVSLN